MTDLYTILGVPRDADQAAIKKAFKKLARKYHPDINKEESAQERFKEISAAYEVLGDEQKRALYDEFGEASLRTGFNAEQARAYKNMGGGGFARGGGPGPDLGSFFGGGGGGGGAGFEDLFGGLFTRRERQVGPRRGADIEGRVQIEFLDAVRGAEIPLQIRRPGACKACNGEGGRGRKSCPTCRGTGRRTVRQLGMSMVTQCDECGGTGSTWADECAVCAGTGRVQESVTLSVKVPPGIESGQQLRLRGQGGAGQLGGPPGDLILTVDVGDHPFLRRNGKDLEMDLPLRIAEALGGASIEVPTPAGRVRVKVPPGSNNGTRLRVGKRGVQGPHPGDLYLVLRPVLPVATDPEAVDLARQLDERDPRDPRAHLSL